MTQFEFRCEIVYDPVSDNCVLVNRSSEQSVYLTHAGDLSMRRQIGRSRKEVIYPGSWRISIKKHETPDCLYPIFEILVLQRRFNISADGENHPSESEQVTGDRAPLIKRQKLNNGMGEVLIYQGSNLFPRESWLRYHYPQAIQDAPQDLKKAIASILDLANGETACIQALHANRVKRKDTYELRRIGKIALMRYTSVFSCRHSKLAALELVVKVPRFDVNDAERMVRLLRFKEGWKQGKKMLENLCHVSESSTYVSSSANINREILYHLRRLIAGFLRYTWSFSLQHSIRHYSLHPTLRHHALHPTLRHSLYPTLRL